jgi:hypothetical protein
MTLHTNRLKKATGAKRRGELQHISVGLSPEDMALLTWWAGKNGVPVASVIRNACWAYTECLRGQYAIDKAKGDGG